MAFAYAVSKQVRYGNMRRKYGTFTNASTDSGGDIVTGFSTINAYGTTVTSHASSFKPKCTVSGGTITVVTENDVDGTWWAEGQ